MADIGLDRIFAAAALLHVTQGFVGPTARFDLDKPVIAAEFPLQVQTTRYALDQANAALAALRAGQVIGAAVLTP